ncbi:hypothetical protein P3L10_000580 [Capsicum annuum]
MTMKQQFDDGFETHDQNSPRLVNYFDMGGPSNAFMNLKFFNSSGPQYPSFVEAIDRFNDYGFTLTQLTEIVNYNDDVQRELDSDEPLQYESSDNDQSNDLSLLVQLIVDELELVAVARIHLAVCILNQKSNAFPKRQQSLTLCI